MQFRVITVGTLLVVSAVCGGEKQDSVNELLTRIEKRLPGNWQASYDPEFAWLAVERKEPTLMFPPIPWLWPGYTGTVMQVAFAFRHVPYMSPPEWRYCKALDEELERDSQCLYDELRAMRVPPAKASFAPVTEEHKRLVASWKALTESRQRLPDYYFRNISLTCDWPWSGDVHSAIADKEIREECAKVERRVLSLLSTYAKNPTRLERIAKGAELLMTRRATDTD